MVSLTIKLAILLGAFVSALSSAEVPPHPHRGDTVLGESKVLIEKPVLVEVKNVETKQNNPDIQLARPVVDPIKPAEEIEKQIPMSKLEPALSKTEDENKNVLPSVQLDPIPLMMMPQLPFGMPPFMQQILDSLKSMSGGDASSSSSNLLQQQNGEVSQESEESGTNSGIRHGSLTILLMKSLKPSNSDDSVDSSNANAEGNNGFKKVILYKFMPRYRLGGKGDPDNDPNFLSENNQANNNGKSSIHLLGGIRDFDSKRFDFLRESNNLLGENDGDRERYPFFNGEIPPLIGSEDSKIESYDPSSNQNQDDWMTKIKSFLYGHKNENPNSMEHHWEHDDGSHNPTGKKCMDIMRLRSRHFFRLALQLLFLSGLFSILGCLSLLLLRHIKRRRALRLYTKNMNVATIEGNQFEDSEQDKKSMGRRIFRFRFGLNRPNGAESDVKSGLSSSFLVQAPPAYDQVTIGGEKKQAEKYSKLSNEEDTKSLTSLPGYEQTVIMKESDAPTNENCHPHHHHHHHPHPHSHNGEEKLFI